MPDSRFVPLAPRRLQRANEIPCTEIEHPAIADTATDQGREVKQQPQGQQEPENHQDPVAVERLDPSGSERSDADAAVIRTAAIRIAAAACARALGYAVDRNPRLVARFVDEALRAAGCPHNAVVRVAPAVTTVGSEARAHDFVADPSLAPGDVFIDCAAGTLGATLDQRADILVRTVAS